jgi:hypothetical protein
MTHEPSSGGVSAPLQGSEEEGPMTIRTEPTALMAAVKAGDAALQ